jgi:hypothetical protein
MAAQPEPKDGLQLLAADHRKVEKLFAEFEKARGVGTKETLVKEICTELKIHTMIEEEIYYPSIKGKVEEPDLEAARQPLPADPGERSRPRGARRAALGEEAGADGAGQDRGSAPGRAGDPGA